MNSILIVFDETTFFYISVLWAIPHRDRYCALSVVHMEKNILFPNDSDCLHLLFSGPRVEKKKQITIKSQIKSLSSFDRVQSLKYYRWEFWLTPIWRMNYTYNETLLLFRFNATDEVVLVNIFVWENTFRSAIAFNVHLPWLLHFSMVFCSTIRYERRFIREVCSVEFTGFS